MAVDVLLFLFVPCTVLVQLFKIQFCWHIVPKRKNQSHETSLL